jgi:hypothetical protein
MGYSDCCADFIYSISEGITEEKMPWGHPLNFTRNEVYSFAEWMKDYLEGGDRYDPVCYPVEVTQGLIDLAKEYLAHWTQGNLVKLLIAAERVRAWHDSQPDRREGLELRMEDENVWEDWRHKREAIHEPVGYDS